MTRILFLLVLCLSFQLLAGPRHIIDTHIHLYDPTRPEGVPWPPKNAKDLYRPVYPKDYMKEIKGTGVDYIVVVEASPWVEDNQWVLDTIRGHHNVVALVGNLPIGEDGFEKALARFDKDDRFVGIRLRRISKDLYRSKKLISHLKQLAKRNLSLDVMRAGVSPADLIYWASQVPDLTIVANHGIGINPNGKPIPEELAKEIRELKNYPNIICKVSGLLQPLSKGENAHSLDFYRPTLDLIWEIFGEDRVIYGSNWPVSDRGGSYKQFLDIMKSYTKEKGDKATQKYFWRNAMDHYRLSTVIGLD